MEDTMVLRSIISPSRYTLRSFDEPIVAMQRALQRTFDEAWQNMPAATETAAISVRLDIREDEKAFHVIAELPGLGDNEVEVTFDDGLLTIRGEKKIARDDKKDTWHVVERSYGSFARQVALPANIDSDQIEAKFEKGVLTVTLPKAAPEQTSAKKISIKAG